MVSKGDLGVSYLLAVGVGVFAALTSGLLMPSGSATPRLGPNAILALVAGIIVAAGFVLTALMLLESDLDGNRVWRVATWGTIGLAVPTVLAIALVAFQRPAVEGLSWRAIAIINISGGGIVGVLIGATTELRAEHDRAKSLNERNTVFLRLFRHDIRTSVNIIYGHIEHIETDESPSNESVEIIENQVNRILRLSEAARQLDRLDSIERRHPVDLPDLIDARVAELREDHPDIAVELDLTPNLQVAANELLDEAVDHLLWNAVQHTTKPPSIEVTVRRAADRSGNAELLIRDDGPGFSENELAVHSGSIETPLQHSDGIGLWLTRWIVNTFEGDITFENDPEAGAAVTVELPTVDPGE